MITTSQKATILEKAGIAVPALPADPLPLQDRLLEPGARTPPQQLGADIAQSVAVEQWMRAIDNLFAGYVAARAARSLREAEDAERMVRLRRDNASDLSVRRRPGAGLN